MKHKKHMAVIPTVLGKNSASMNKDAMRINNITNIIGTVIASCFKFLALIMFFKGTKILFLSVKQLIFVWYIILLNTLSGFIVPFL